MMEQQLRVAVVVERSESAGKVVCGRRVVRDALRDCVEREGRTLSEGGRALFKAVLVGDYAPCGGPLLTETHATAAHLPFLESLRKDVKDLRTVYECCALAEGVALGLQFLLKDPDASKLLFVVTGSRPSECCVSEVDSFVGKKWMDLARVVARNCISVAVVATEDFPELDSFFQMSAFHTMDAPAPVEEKSTEDGLTLWFRGMEIPPQERVGTAGNSAQSTVEVRLELSPPHDGTLGQEMLALEGRLSPINVHQQIFPHPSFPATDCSLDKSLFEGTCFVHTQEFPLSEIEKPLFLVFQPGPASVELAYHLTSAHRGPWMMVSSDSYGSHMGGHGGAGGSQRGSLPMVLCPLSTILHGENTRPFRERHCLFVVLARGGVSSTLPGARASRADHNQHSQQQQQQQQHHHHHQYHQQQRPLDYPDSQFSQQQQQRTHLQPQQYSAPVLARQQPPQQTNSSYPPAVRQGTVSASSVQGTPGSSSLPPAVSPNGQLVTRGFGRGVEAGSLPAPPYSVPQQQQQQLYHPQQQYVQPSGRGSGLFQNAGLHRSAYTAGLDGQYNTPAHHQQQQEQQQWSGHATQTQEPQQQQPRQHQPQQRQQQQQQPRQQQQQQQPQLGFGMARANAGMRGGGSGGGAGGRGGGTIPPGAGVGALHGRVQGRGGFGGAQPGSAQRGAYGGRGAGGRGGGN